MGIADGSGSGSPESELRNWMSARTPGMVEELRTLVEMESPTGAKDRLDRLADRLAARFEGLGARAEVRREDRAGNHVRWRWEPRDAARRKSAPALVVCHFDTVWPLGTLAGMPFVADFEADVARGPGTLDMKASLAIVAAALEALGESGVPGWSAARPVVGVFTSDEETGSATSREWIEEEARRAAFALVMEPATASGALKTSRKGVGRFEIEAIGRAAHAGIEPEKGVNAIVELARRIVAAAELGNHALGTTVNAGRIEGGGALNVVPDRARAWLDARAATAAEATRLEADLRALGCSGGDGAAEIRVSGGFNRPPMERSEGVGRLFERARAIGARLGLDLREESSGGGSDGNFTAAVGTPTLDGLGARGAGAHAPHEHARISSLGERAALLTALLAELEP